MKVGVKVFQRYNARKLIRNVRCHRGSFRRVGELLQVGIEYHVIGSGMHRQIDDGVQRLEATSVLVKDGSREQGQLANSTTDLTLQTIPPNAYRFYLDQVPKW